MKEKLREYLRVLRTARRPSKEEFEESLKVMLIGIFLIGLFGLIVHIIFQSIGV